MIKKPFYPILALFFSYSTVYSQNQRDTLTEVTISENRIESKIHSTGRNVLVWSKKDLQASVGQTPNDWLGFTPGVDIRQRGPVGVQADIGIRGGSFDQTLVLLNGMKLSDPQTGHHLMNLPITNEAIEQIEVVKGGASRMYGINALTGSVNFITKVPESNMVYGGGFGGDFGLYGLHAGVTLHHSKLGQHLSYARTGSDGYKPNTDFTQNQLFYQATYQQKNGKLHLIGGLTTRDFGAAGFYVANSTEYEQTQTAFGGIQYEWKWRSWKVKPQVYYRYNDDAYVFKRENPSFFRNQHYSHTLSAELHVSYTSALGVTGFGADTRSEELASNNLGAQTRNISGFFIEHRLALFQQRLLITPGMYATFYTGNQQALFPGIDASYRIYKHWVLFASADKGMRLPTFTDMYYKGPNNIGNPELKAEEAISTEAGLRYANVNWAASASVFRRQSDNLIDWARKEAAQKWQPLNLNEVIYSGFDVAIRKSFRGILQQTMLGYTFIDAHFNLPEQYTSRYTLTHIRHQVIGSLRFNWFKKCYQTLVVRHINRTAMTDYTLIDTKVSYDWAGFSVYVDISNILNTKYMEAGYVTMPGTWTKIGFNFKLNYRS